MTQSISNIKQTTTDDVLEIILITAGARIDLEPDVIQKVRTSINHHGRTFKVGKEVKTEEIYEGPYIMVDVNKETFDSNKKHLLDNDLYLCWMGLYTGGRRIYFKYPNQE